MASIWKFTRKILLVLAIASLPVIHYFTGSEWSGSLASFVLGLFLLLLGLMTCFATLESKKALNGELKADKLAIFMKAFPARTGDGETLSALARTAWTVGFFVIAAAGYEWFAGFLLLFYWISMAAEAIARDTSELIRSKSSMGA
jgi:ABC-type transport system involved in multi-copper enzyme maturation permease subunit